MFIDENYSFLSINCSRILAAFLKEAGIIGIPHTPLRPNSWGNWLYNSLLSFYAPSRLRDREGIVDEFPESIYQICESEDCFSSQRADIEQTFTALETEWIQNILSRKASQISSLPHSSYVNRMSLSF